MGGTDIRLDIAEKNKLKDIAVEPINENEQSIISCRTNSSGLGFVYLRYLSKPCQVSTKEKTKLCFVISQLKYNFPETLLTPQTYVKLR